MGQNLTFLQTDCLIHFIIGIGGTLGLATAFQILLTLPVSLALGERSFRKMQLISLCGVCGG
jgi:hypothetical protein